MYPALERRNNLLRSLKSTTVERSFYDPAVDRKALYALPQRARFWPGSDSLYGDEWQYWYGDIAIPDQLSRPRRRPSCLGDEAALNSDMLRRMRGTEEETSAASLRSRRASAGGLESAVSATQQSMEHLSRARSLRASSVSRLQATRQSMERDARALRASSVSRRGVSPVFNDDLYADIEIPEELTRPRRRPVSLQRESSVERYQGALQQRSGSVERYQGALQRREGSLARQQESSLLEEQNSAASRAASQYLRSMRAQSAQKMSSTETTTEETTSRRVARGRSALRAASEQSDYLGLDTSKVYVPRWLENHPIQDAPTVRRPPPSDIWPEKRPFYDLKNDYDTMLSYMGVTKDLRKVVSAGAAY